MFTKEGQKVLLDTFNEVRRTIAYGEEEGQPPAANMRKMVIIEKSQYIMSIIIGRFGPMSLQSLPRDGLTNAPMHMTKRGTCWMVPMLARISRHQGLQLSQGMMLAMMMKR